MTCDQFQMQLGQLRNEVSASDMVQLIGSEMDRLIGSFTEILNKFASGIKSHPQLNGAAIAQTETSTVKILASLKQPAIDDVWEFFAADDGEDVTRAVAVRTFGRVCRHQSSHMWNFIAAAVEKMKSYVRGLAPPRTVTTIGINVNEVEHYFQRHTVQPNLWKSKVRESTISSTVAAFIAKMNELISTFEQETVRIQAPGQAGKLIADLRAHGRIGKSTSSGFFLESLAFAQEYIRYARNEAQPSKQHTIANCLRSIEDVADIGMCFTTPIETIKVFKERVESINASVNLMTIDLALSQ